ncbi:hypothetical protein [Erythrobacter sp. EC-HK427]|uniref:hypothetical protein n=1 Tax=Erythrobacter sp. EC-HK427 TaxID=2038396 RepID=UPI001254095C|nr:hypothetical protein [Erythrobacter sp. EC-HK427]VVT12222.1 conserved hypothetical protein [Erythrobacter sp. EC-HK427]
MAMQITPVEDATIDAALRKGAHLVAQATATGLAFAFDELGHIDLPADSALQVDKAQLRALASLYLAAELEPAGVIPAAEALAGLAGSSLNIALGPVRPLVGEFWEKRRQRPDEAERNAFFARLYGTSSGPLTAGVDRNTLFEDRMLTLCEALIALNGQAGGQYGGFTGQARVRSAARKLLANVLGASGGITAFLAGEIVATLKSAFAILGHPHLRGQFGARNIWDVVAAIFRLSGRPMLVPSAYIRRGKAGMTILAWLAEAAETLESNAPLVQPSDPVIGAATEWIEAVLEIGESVAQVGPSAPAARASPWTQIGY